MTWVIFEKLEALIVWAINNSILKYIKKSLFIAQISKNENGLLVCDSPLSL